MSWGRSCARAATLSPDWSRGPAFPERSGYTARSRRESTMPHGDPRLARACAELIRDWHERFGTAHRPSNMDEGQFARYRERVAYFHNADLSNLSSQEEIAAEQRSRVFERYYGVIVPPELWQHVTHVHEIIDHRPPEHLGQAAS